MNAEPYRWPWFLQHLRLLVLGVLVGLVAVGFREALRFVPVLLDRAVLFTGGGLPELVARVALSGLMILPAFWIVARFCPEAAGSGIPDVKAQVRNPQPMRWPRLLLVKFTSGVLAIGGGLVLGREGPTIQMGAALTDLFGWRGKLTAGERRQLMLVGAGAGLAGAFNAPLAGAVLVFEEFGEDFRPSTCLSALMATFSACAICRLFTGQLPELGTYEEPPPALAYLPCFLLLGWLGGLLGVMFNQFLLALLRVRSRLNRLFLPVLLAVTVGILSFLHPGWVGDSYTILDEARDGALPLRVAVILLVLRAALTIGGYAVGTAGGLFAPLLVLGALLGHILSFFCTGPDPRSLVVVGMAALFSGVVRAPFTGVLLLLEMAGAHALTLPLIAASVMAKLTADALGDRPIYDALLELKPESRNEG